MQPQLIAGRYQVLRAIGRGGMGTVWLCLDEVLGRRVAVKQIGALPGESATETKRAMREARSAAALNHPNAVAVYDVVTHDERPWLVMEYVEGQTLADEISRDGQLSPQRVADIGAQLASALARAHESSIVHRDIKPANVLIDKAGRPKISDFGIARGHGDDQLTAIGFITGTPGYLSPELARGGDPHPASDVWALGATLYEAVEGQSPYEPRSNPIALLRAIATERPRPMTHAGALGPAIATMMHEDPARRWDMATSAKRLGGISGFDTTAVIAALPVESTQRLEVAALPVESTQRLEVAAPDDRTSRRRWLSLGFVAMLVAALSTAYLLSMLGDQGSPAVLGTIRPTAPVKATTPSTAKVPAPPITTGRADKDLESFVKSYYSDVTKQTDKTWDQLTPRMQDAAGGLDGYEGFWKTIEKVRVNRTRAGASASTAILNLTFTRKDGTTTTETHELTFVADDENYLIDGDRLVR